MRQPTMAILLLAAAINASNASAANTDLASKIDRYIAPFVAGNNFPGVILIGRGDSILVNKAYGMANYELRVPNTTRSRFHIASLTKMFTAVNQ